MAPPVCSRCGSTALAFLSDEMVWNWRDEKGVKWDYKDGLGYMRLCQTCHGAVRATLPPIFWVNLFCSGVFCFVSFLLFPSSVCSCSVPLRWVVVAVAGLLLQAGPGQRLVRFLAGLAGGMCLGTWSGVGGAIGCRVARVWPEDRRTFV